jgi:hypothetical protein
MPDQRRYLQHAVEVGGSGVTRNAICVKWGSKYPAAEVNRLFRAVSRNVSGALRFFCLTDDPAGIDPEVETLPLQMDSLQSAIASAQTRLQRSGGALRKIAAFNPTLVPDLAGPLLCLDLDIIITGSLDDLFDYRPGQICMPAPFRKAAHIPTLGEGSVIRFDPALHGFLYSDMLSQTDAMLEHSRGSEQRYTSFTAQRYGQLANYPDGWVVGFQRHCRPRKPLNLFLPPRLPAAARVVCFPSDPKAEAAVAGYRKGINSTLPAPWISDFL